MVRRPVAGAYSKWPSGRGRAWAEACSLGGLSDWGSDRLVRRIRPPNFKASAAHRRRQGLSQWAIAGGGAVPGERCSPNDHPMVTPSPICGRHALRMLQPILPAAKEHDMQAFAAQMTSKYQVVIPKAVREALGLRPRDTVLFLVQGQTVFLRPRPSSFTDALLGLHGELWDNPEASLEQERSSWE